VNEQRAAQFYQAVADAADDPEVRQLALEFAAEEREHTAALDRVLAATLRF